MSKSSGQQQLSKRQAIKQQRQQQARRQRLITIISITGIIALLIAVITIPQTQKANAPVGEFVEVTPENYTNTDGFAIGDPNAPATIEVFSDYKCTACAAYSQSIEPEVISELVQTGKAYYIFRQYPFMDDQSNIKDSDLAAHASVCAADQNRFYDYKKILYANMNNIIGEFSERRLIAFAESLNLNVDDFEACMNDDQYKENIQSDINKAESLQITGTPSLFVNGVQIAPGYVPSFEQINEAVQANTVSKN